MLGHLGWVQFSNGVSVNTHKEFALEILMTMAPILDEGCKVYHSVWRVLTVDFGTPSYEFTVNIFTYLIF
jgi:hypothetical protein